MLLIAACAAAAVASAALNGIPYGNDLTQHYQFAASVEENLAAGGLYPSMAPTPNNTVGDYGLRFYPPLAYYALAAGFKVTGGWFSASILVFFLLYFAGGAGVYLWVREEFPEKQAIIAGALFVFAPYHLNQIYNNFLYGEFAASAVIPFCFLFLHRTARSPSFGSAAGLAAAYGALILTHLPSLIFCSIAFAAYAVVVLLRSGTFFRGVPALAASVAVSVAATSFYWIRLVTELEWINHSRAEYFSGNYDYSNNFLLHPRNITNFSNDVLAIWMGDLMLAAMVLISIPSLIFLFKRKEKVNSLLLGSLAAMTIAVVMSSVLSKPLWDGLGFLQKIQFPWRWLGVISVSGAAFASFGIAAATEKLKVVGGPIIAVALAAGLIAFTVSAIFITKQSVFIPRGEFTNAAVARMHSDPSRDCWWTVWAKDGFYRAGKERAVSSGRRVRVVSWKSLEKKVALDPGPEATVIFRVLYYPHWRAYSNGERLEATPSDTGLIAVNAPAGTRSLELRFREPDTVRAAAVVSAAALVLIVFSALFPVIRRTFRKEPVRVEARPAIEG